jgi:hypothetical protein
MAETSRPGTGTPRCRTLPERIRCKHDGIAVPCQCGTEWLAESHAVGIAEIAKVPSRGTDFMRSREVRPYFYPRYSGQEAAIGLIR